jgi:hypothetical protein
VTIFAAAPPRPAALSLPLLRFLNAQGGEGGEWRGSLSELRQRLPGSVLPPDDAGLVANLRQLRPGLAQQGWSMRWPMEGEPIRFVRRSRKPARLRHRAW